MEAETRSAPQGRRGEKNRKIKREKKVGGHGKVKRWDERKERVKKANRNGQKKTKEPSDIRSPVARDLRPEPRLSEPSERVCHSTGRPVVWQLSGAVTLVLALSLLSFPCLLPTYLLVPISVAKYGVHRQA